MTRKCSLSALLNDTKNAEKRKANCEAIVNSSRTTSPKKRSPVTTIASGPTNDHGRGCGCAVTFQLFIGLDALATFEFLMISLKRE